MGSGHQNAVFTFHLTNQFQAALSGSILERESSRNDAKVILRDAEAVRWAGQG